MEVIVKENASVREEDQLRAIDELVRRNPGTGTDAGRYRRRQGEIKLACE